MKKLFYKLINAYRQFYIFFMFQNKNNLYHGFTLIELLVVISIIGLLSTFALISLDNARKKARNAKRSADLKQIQSAIENYAQDHGGQYLSTGGVKRCLGVPSSETCWGGFTGNDALNAALEPYLKNIPKDPLYGKRGYGAYLYQAPGNYWLPVPIDTVNGSYAIAFAPDDTPDASESLCLGWKWAAWDIGFHCVPWCRQCGYLGGN